VKDFITLSFFAHKALLHPTYSYPIDLWTYKDWGGLTIRHNRQSAKAQRGKRSLHNVKEVKLLL